MSIYPSHSHRRGKTSRRRLLAAVGGVAGTVTFGYVGARVAAREGEVVTRIVQGETLDDGTLTDSVELFYAELAPDGHERRFHPDYRDTFSGDPPITVTPSPIANSRERSTASPTTSGTAVPTRSARRRG